MPGPHAGRGYYQRRTSRRQSVLELYCVSNRLHIQLIPFCNFLRSLPGFGSGLDDIRGDPRSCGDGLAKLAVGVEDDASFHPKRPPPHELVITGKL